MNSEKPSSPLNDQLAAHFKECGGDPNPNDILWASDAPEARSLGAWTAEQVSQPQEPCIEHRNGYFKGECPECLAAAGGAKPRPDLANFHVELASRLAAQPEVVFDAGKAKRIQDWNEISQKKV